MQVSEFDCHVCAFGYIEVVQFPCDDAPVYMCLCCNTRRPEIVVPPNVVPFTAYRPKTTRQEGRTVWLC